MSIVTENLCEICQIVNIFSVYPDTHQAVTVALIVSTRSSGQVSIESRFYMN